MPVQAELRLHRGLIRPPQWPSVLAPSEPLKVPTSHSKGRAKLKSQWGQVKAQWQEDWRHEALAGNGGTSVNIACIHIKVIHNISTCKMLETSPNIHTCIYIHLCMKLVRWRQWCHPISQRGTLQQTDMAMLSTCTCTAEWQRCGGTSADLHSLYVSIIPRSTLCKQKRSCTYHAMGQLPWQVLMSV